jgi:hypothetical protein
VGSRQGNARGGQRSGHGPQNFTSLFELPQFIACFAVGIGASAAFLGVSAAIGSVFSVPMAGVGTIASSVFRFASIRICE